MKVPEAHATNWKYNMKILAGGSFLCSKLWKKTQRLQHSQEQKDHYFLILQIQKERTGENHTSTTLARTRHMSRSISQAGNFWKKTETSCFSLKQNMWIWSLSRLGWPFFLILSICNSQLQCGRVDPPGEQIHQVQTCGLTYLMFVYRSFYRNGCCVKVTETALGWWTNVCLYRYVGTRYRNIKVWNWFFPFLSPTNWCVAT